MFIDERQVTDGTGKVVAAVFEVSTPEELQMLKIENEQTENIVLGLLDWKVSSNTHTHTHNVIPFDNSRVFRFVVNPSRESSGGSPRK